MQTCALYLLVQILVSEIMQYMYMKSIQIPDSANVCQTILERFYTIKLTLQIFPACVEQNCRVLPDLSIIYNQIKQIID